MVIDSHVHINKKVLKNIKETIEEINQDENILSVINVGLDINTSKECINISKTNNKIYTSIGIHPLYIENENCNNLYNLITNKVVAIGEIGLDSTNNNFLEQKKYLIRQIHIANELKLPVIIHSNNTNKEIINIFKFCVKPEYGCIFHCFQPDINDLNYLIDNGYYISFSGKITYKTAKKSIEILKQVPNDLFLVETDSPYITPEPFRNCQNKSSNINLILDVIANIKKMNYNELEDLVNKNTKTLFKRINRK